MAIPQVAAAVSATELSILGVDSAKPPSASNFPRKFNREAFAIWKQVLEEVATRDWYTVIPAYLKACDRAGVFAFKESTVTDNNEIVAAFLAKARQQIVRYFNEAQIFNNAKLTRVTNREYRVNRDNLTIRVEGEIKLTDPTATAWLLSNPVPGMRKSADVVQKNHFSKSIQAHLEVWVRLAPGGKAYAGFSIFCHTVPIMNGMKRMPTKNQMNGFIEKNLWLPLVRQHRINKTGNKLF